MTAPGTKVYVSWYGRTLEGVVADGEGFMGMTPVRIPLDGHHPVALFFPQHVYSSPELLTGISEKQSKFDRSLTEVDNNRSKVSKIDVPTVSDHSRPLPTVSDSSTKASPSEAWQAIQKFKEEHWDQERNHLRIDALNDFYRLWRIAVAARYGVTIEEAPVTVVAVDPGSPDGDKSATIIVDTETGEILPELPAEVEHRPIVSEERYQELKEKMKVKLTKNQKNSTGRIEYIDSIQTSLFD